MRDAVSQHTVKANRRQEHRHTREAAKQLHGEAPLRDRRTDQLRHGADVFERLVFVNSVQLDADRASDLCRVALCAHSQAFIAPVHLPVGPVHLTARGLRHTGPLGVPH